MTRGNGTVTTYGYDPASRLTGLAHDFAGSEQNVTSSFTYNPASQIASQTQSGLKGIYLWDGINNVTRPYTTNGLNQYTQSGGTSLGYDGNGNLTNSGADTYRYTLENRLAEAPGGKQFGHDALGRMWLFRNGDNIYFQHDGDVILRESSNTGLLRRYVYGPGSDEPILWYEGAGTSDKRYLHADERGSIVALRDKFRGHNTN